MDVEICRRFLLANQNSKSLCHEATLQKVCKNDFCQRIQGTLNFFP